MSFFSETTDFDDPEEKAIVLADPPVQINQYNKCCLWNNIEVSACGPSTKRNKY